VVSESKSSVWRVEIAVPRAAAPPFAEAIEAHCAAVSWTAPDEGDALIIAFTADEPNREAIGIALEAIAEVLDLDVPHARFAPEAPRDWVVETEVRFPALDVGRFHIMGSHIAEAPPLGRIALRIDAGPAFGSGEHGSTSGCLMALEGLAHRPVRRILDMGCGSGILAIAAARIWQAPVLACDIDRRSVAVTRINADRNGVGRRIRAATSDGYHCRSVGECRPYDLIVNNILARPLMRLAGDLGRHLAPGGVAVLSGFIARDAARVLFAHRAAGLRLRRKIEIDGWVALVVGR
jgi:ribosomal protein L11 methyltransferase